MRASTSRSSKWVWAVLGIRRTSSRRRRRTHQRRPGSHRGTGPDIAAIASDKVGIFRADAIAIVATTNAIVVEIAQRRAVELGADLWLLGASFTLEQNELALGGRAITLRTPFTRYEELLVSLHGIHQGVNAATAIVAAEAFLVARSVKRRSPRHSPRLACRVVWSSSRASQ